MSISYKPLLVCNLYSSYSRILQSRRPLLRLSTNTDSPARVLELVVLTHHLGHPLFCEENLSIVLPPCSFDPLVESVGARLYRDQDLDGNVEIGTRRT